MIGRGGGPGRSRARAHRAAAETVDNGDGAEGGDELGTADEHGDQRGGGAEASLLEDGLLVVEHRGLPRELLQADEAEARHQRAAAGEELRTGRAGGACEGWSIGSQCAQEYL